MNKECLMWEYASKKVGNEMDNRFRYMSYIVEDIEEEKNNEHFEFYNWLENKIISIENEELITLTNNEGETQLISLKKLYSLTMHGKFIKFIDKEEEKVYNNFEQLMHVCYH